MTWRAAPARGVALRRMTRWLEASGAKISRVALHPRHGGEWSARATEHIDAGDCVFSIPLTCIRSGEPEELVQFVIDEEARADSRWRPYLEALPRRFPHHPLFYTPRELELLEGSFLLDELRAQREAFGDGARARASLIVASRSFGIDIGGRPQTALVPLMDMLDHRSPPPTAWHCDREAVQLQALYPIARGAAVHDNYGEKCNSRLLLCYGFCEEDNPFNEARVVVGRRAFVVPADLKSEGLRDLLTHLRVLHSDEPCDPRFLRAPRSQPNEVAAIDALAFACRAALAAFSTSLEEDDALLERRLSVNARNAILMRRGEKRVLRWLCNFADAVLPWLRGDIGELLDAAASGRLGLGELDQWLAFAAVGMSRAPRRA